MTARGIRNNNPGNIVQSKVDWKGKVSSPTDDRFEQFDTPEHGLLALCQNLINYQDHHGCKTIRQVIDRWAPPVENNTDAYIASVVASVGVGADDPMDIHDPRMLSAIAHAIIKVENGEDPYPAAMVEAAVAEALGVAPATETPKPTTSGRAAVDPLSILNIVGAGLSILLPQVGKVFGGKKDAANAQLAGTILDIVSQTAGTAKPGEPPTLGSTATAMEAMQKDPALTARVQQAVVTHPDIIETLQVTEVGGGIEKAAARSVAIQVADKPFWYNPLTWVTLAFFPMMYMICYQVLFTLAGPYMVSNGIPNTPLTPNPWFAVVGFDPNTRTGLINLIVGFVFGGVCGIWFGTTVTKSRTEQQVANDAATAAAAAVK